jgi:hypothetical protein
MEANVSVEGPLLHRTAWMHIEQMRTMLASVLQQATIHLFVSVILCLCPFFHYESSDIIQAIQHIVLRPSSNVAYSQTVMLPFRINLYYSALFRCSTVQIL